MTHVLFEKNVRTLARALRTSSVLVAFDFDGVLAPIVAQPGAAKMRPWTRSLLRLVTWHFPCAVISGRARADVAERLSDTKVRCIIGNHGIEWEEPIVGSDRWERLVKRWRAELALQLGVYGVFIEDKRYSLAIHFRNARSRAKAKTVARAAVRRLDGASWFSGKEVVNVVPKGSDDKGRALRRAQHLFGCDTALYVGDDVTDESVFERGQREGWITVRVGQSKTSNAAYYLRNQKEIDKLLETLLSLRSVTDGRQSQRRP